MLMPPGVRCGPTGKELPGSHVDDERGGSRCTGLLRVPESHRVKTHSTNTLERLNKEVKRRADVAGIFPNKESISRLPGAVLTEQNEEWPLQNHYLP